FVNDQASTDLVVEFYRHLSQSPVRNKALALRAAQCSLLRQERYRHPCYWAPYLIIGNWM
ncbi:MAG: CHAT domain-containing protein, partial [Verrucomicrobia bacterium]|nr:CHAT domain-containing protein [Verrucomicrobiota bacterium]